MQDWQFVQLVHAIEIFIVSHPDVKHEPDIDWSHLKSNALEIKPYHATHARISNNLDVAISNKYYKNIFKYYNETTEALVISLRVRQYTYRTEQNYLQWVLRFLEFNKPLQVDSPNEAHVQAFLEYLAVSRKVSHSTQSLAFNAIVNLFRYILSRPLNNIALKRASQTKRIPTVYLKKKYLHYFPIYPVCIH